MELAPIGYFSKTHGVKGQLILREDAAFEISRIKAVFVEEGGSKAPYFISSFRETKNGIMLGLENVSTVEKARQLVGKNVYADEQFVEEESDTNEWQGFMLEDKNYGELGIIVESSDNGSHEVVNVLFKGREVILPLVEEFIELIDEDSKRIYYKAPEGLIDIYLGEKEE